MRGSLFILLPKPTNPPREDRVSLLERSNQRWKIFLFIALMALGAGVTLLQGFLYAPLGRELTLQLVIGGMILLPATFIWACGSIVCPSCAQKLLIYAITKVGLGTWFVWLMTEEQCPKCGYSGRPETSAKRKGKR